MKLIRLLALLLAAIPTPALAEGLNSTSQPPKQVNVTPELQLVNLFLPGEEPRKLPEIDILLKPKRIESPKIEPSQMLPSDKLINRSVRFDRFWFR